jgi:hypothetical protein
VQGPTGDLPSASVKVGKTTVLAQPIPNNTATAVVWDVDGPGPTFFDTDGMFDIASPTRLTCNTAGKYLVTGSQEFSSIPPVGSRAVIFRVNGGSFTATQSGVPDPAVSPSVVSLTTSGLYDLAVGDYIEMYVYQNSGGSMDLPVSVGASPLFSAVLVSQ